MSSAVWTKLLVLLLSLSHTWEAQGQPMDQTRTSLPTRIIGPWKKRNTNDKDLGSKNPRRDDPLQGRLSVARQQTLLRTVGGQLQSVARNPRALMEKYLHVGDENGNLHVDLGSPKSHKAERTMTTAPLVSLFQRSSSDEPQSTKKEEPKERLPVVRAPKDSSQQNLAVSLSIDPMSLTRLLQTLSFASVGAVGAFGATLRLLAPMIFARRVLSTAAYVVYDYYNGRYLRTTYTKRMQHMQRYEVPSALRACGRLLCQITAMWVAGALVNRVLSRANCQWLSESACTFWHALVWTVAVTAAGRVVDRWVSTSPSLRIRTIEESGHFNQFSKHLRFKQPWPTVQNWLKDPEDCILQLTRLHPDSHNGNQHSNGHGHHADFSIPPFEPDSLLLPSTWPPLQVFAAIAMVLVLSRPQLDVVHNSHDLLGSLMLNYAISTAVHDEWGRVLLGEHRISLGVVLSILSFAATWNLVNSVLSVHDLAGLLLVPGLLASLMSGWMNTVLYFERHVVTRSWPWDRVLNAPSK